MLRILIFYKYISKETNIHLFVNDLTFIFDLSAFECSGNNF